MRIHPTRSRFEREKCPVSSWGPEFHLLSSPLCKKGALMFLQDRPLECPIYYPEASTSMTMTLHHVWNGSKWTLFACSGRAAVLHVCTVSADLPKEGESSCFASAAPIPSNDWVQQQHMCVRTNRASMKGVLHARYSFVRQRTALFFKLVALEWPLSSS